VSITFLRSPVLAILAISEDCLLLCVSLHSSAAADGFNGRGRCSLLAPFWGAPSKLCLGGLEENLGSLTPVYTNHPRNRASRI
jgi:hypothetical protein